MSAVLGSVRQVGYAVDDLDQAIQGWLHLGVGPFFRIERLPLQGFTYRGTPSDAQIAVGLAQSGNVQIELIQPLDEEPSMFGEFLAAGQRGIHHVAYWTEQFDDDLRACIAAGLRVGQRGCSGSGAPDERFAYLEPTGIPGTVIELSEVSGAKGDTFREVAATAEGWDGRDPVRRLG